uniref:KxDL domain-containing protein n=1 Tax=Timema douglasi TaxID=61478 RepID=A0A7R8VFU9_TIMDO|nr:unnamed protein product [Timema douglasi]
MAENTPESDLGSIECFQNYTAPEVFIQGLAGIVDQQDVESMIIAQKQMLQRFEKTNEMLTNCNALSVNRLKSAGAEFKKHTLLLLDMKKDLDNIFKRIRVLKTKLSTQYPQSFAERDWYHALSGSCTNHATHTTTREGIGGESKASLHLTARIRVLTALVRQQTYTLSNPIAVADQSSKLDEEESPPRAGPSRPKSCFEPHHTAASSVVPTDSSQPGTHKQEENELPKTLIEDNKGEQEEEEPSPAKRRNSSSTDSPNGNSNNDTSPCTSDTG